jgi:hypothetical protein
LTNETPDVSLPEDFAEYEALRNGTPQQPAAPATESKEESSDAPGDGQEDESVPESDTGDLEQDEEPQPEEKKAKGKGGFKKRIDKLNGRIAELEGQLAGTPPAAKSSEAAPAEAIPSYESVTPKPKLDECESLEDFAEKLSDWKADERDYKREQVKEKEARQQEANQLVTKWNEATDAAKERYEDYDDVIASVDAIAIPQSHQRLLLDSEQGPELAYHLAQKPEDLKRFVAMSPIAASREIGRLEARLDIDKPSTKAPQPKTTRVSKAPEPVTPVRAGKGAKATPSDSALADDYSAWEADRNAQIYRR